MFTRVVALATAASLFLFAAAAPTSQCNAGKMYCCNQTQEVEKMDKSTGLLMQLLGINVNALTGSVGTNCSPLGAVALGGPSWYALRLEWTLNETDSCLMKQLIPAGLLPR